MSKVRINDLAREMEVKSRQISSLEDYEADKVRAQFERSSRSSQSSAASRAPQGIQPKIDLSNVSKPGDVLKAIQARKEAAEAEARQSHLPVRQQPPTSPVAVVAAPPRPTAPPV
jgi:translation initiation factor IF-2